MVDVNSAEFLERLRQWSEKMNAAKKAVEEEKTMRIALFNDIFPTLSKDDASGTKTVDLKGGWKIKGEAKQNDSLDQAVAATIIPKLRELGVEVDKLFPSKLGLSVAEYKKLDGDAKLIAAEAVSFKKGTPTLTLVPPKAV